MFEVGQEIKMRIKRHAKTSLGFETFDDWRFGDVVRLDLLNPDVVEVMWSDGFLQVVETKNLQAA